WPTGCPLNGSGARADSRELAPLAIQYAAFAAGQSEWLQGDVLDRQLAYWKQQLDGTATVLEVPADRPRPAVQTHRGAHETFTINAATSAMLRRLSGERGATLFMTLLAGFEVLLSRYTNQK